MHVKTMVNSVVGAHYLQVGTANLNDVVERFRLCVKGVPQLNKCGEERSVDLSHSGDVHRSGEPGRHFDYNVTETYTTYDVRVIAALAHVDMVVRVDRLLGPALTTEDLDRAVGDDLRFISTHSNVSGESIWTYLVRVHVALSTTASLEDDKRELSNELSRDDLRQHMSSSRSILTTMGRTSSAASWIAFPTFGSMPYPTLTIDAAFFSTPNALMRGSGRRSEGPPMSKFCNDLKGS